MVNPIELYIHELHIWNSMVNPGDQTSNYHNGTRNPESDGCIDSRPAGDSSTSLPQSLAGESVGPKADNSDNKHGLNNSFTRIKTESFPAKQHKTEDPTIPIPMSSQSEDEHHNERRIGWEKSKTQSMKRPEESFQSRIPQPIKTEQGSLSPLTEYERDHAVPQVELVHFQKILYLIEFPVTGFIF